MSAVVVGPAPRAAWRDVVGTAWREVLARLALAWLLWRCRAGQGCLVGDLERAGRWDVLDRLIDDLERGEGAA